jgi:hypothetical protein
MIIEYATDNAWQVSFLTWRCTLGTTATAVKICCKVSELQRQAGGTTVNGYANIYTV